MGKHFASRKFVLALLVFVVATGLLIAGLIEANDWKTITIWAFSGYLAANVTQKATEKPPAPVEMPTP
jgi:spermidine/putrescine-binding protein